MLSFDSRAKGQAFAMMDEVLVSIYLWIFLWTFSLIFTSEEVRDLDVVYMQVTCPVSFRWHI